MYSTRSTRRQVTGGPYRKSLFGTPPLPAFNFLHKFPQLRQGYLLRTPFLGSL